MVTAFTFPSAMQKVCQSLRLLANTCYCPLLTLAILLGVKRYLTGVLMYVSLMTGNAEHLVQCVLAAMYSCFKPKGLTLPPKRVPPNPHQKSTTTSYELFHQLG